MAWGYRFREYVPVKQRRANARRHVDSLRRQGKTVRPVEIEGRTIARSVWGKTWCEHLESFSDFESRLPRGRTYVRNGSVCHLDIAVGKVEALVSGSEIYRVSLRVAALTPGRWKEIVARCAGHVGSMLELLEGRLSDEVMSVVSDRRRGLFPQPDEIELACSCPDWAMMCKHVAATLYGVGNRLDRMPELLFTLRGVDAADLIAADIAIPAAAVGDALAEEAIAEIFDIDLDGLEGNAELERTDGRDRSRRVRSRRTATPSSKRKTSASPAPTATKPPAKRKTSASAAPAATKSPAKRKTAPAATKPPAKRKTSASAAVGAARTPAKRKTSASATRAARPKKRTRAASVRRPTGRTARADTANTGAVKRTRERGRTRSGQPRQQSAPRRATPSNRLPTGASVARLRKALRMSVVDMARTLAVSPATIYRWEATRGRLNLQRRTFEAIALLRRRTRNT